MKCCWCQKEITNSPFVEKKWTKVDETELYHTHCFMVAHKGLLDNVPSDIPQDSIKDLLAISGFPKEELS